MPLLADLERDGHAESARTARRLIAELECAQRLAVEHLGRQQAKQ